MRFSKALALALALCCGPVWAQKIPSSQAREVPATTNSIPIAGTVATQTQIIAGVPGQSIYVTSVDLVPAPTSTIQFVQGTGTNCLTGGSVIHAATDLGPGTVFSKGGGWGAQWTLAPGNSLCITIQTNPAPGSLAYSLVGAGSVGGTSFILSNTGSVLLVAAGSRFLIQ